jgi:hypothetical protein
MLIPPTPLSHLLWSLLYLLWLQLLMSSMRASPMMRLPYWRESFKCCTSSTRKGRDHRGVASSAVTPLTSSSTTPSGRSSTPPPTSTTTTTDKGEGKKKYRFGDKKKRKKFQKMMSRACAAINDLDFSIDDSYNSEEDEKPKRKQDDFTGLCLMGKFSRHNFDYDSDVSDDLSPDSLSLRVIDLENAL